MEMYIEKLDQISDVATVAWCAAETGELTPEVYAGVFEYIVEALHALAQDVRDERD